MNKKGYSLSGWAETAIFTTLFILLIISLYAGMNVRYSQNYDGTFGLSNLATNTKDNLSTYQSTLQQSVSTGESSSSGQGISLSTTWNIITAGAGIMWSFLTGGWIEQLTGIANLPTIVGSILRIIYVLSIGFIILRLVLKLKP